MKNKPQTQTTQQCLGNFTNIELLCVVTSGPHISLWKCTPVSQYSWKAAVTTAKSYVPIYSAIL